MQQHDCPVDTVDGRPTGVRPLVQKCWAAKIAAVVDVQHVAAERSHSLQSLRMTAAAAAAAAAAVLQIAQADQTMKTRLCAGHLYHRLHAGPLPDWAPEGPMRNAARAYGIATYCLERLICSRSCSLGEMVLPRDGCWFSGTQ